MALRLNSTALLSTTGKIMKFTLACFRTTTAFGQKERKRIVEPDRMLPLEKYEVDGKGSNYEIRGVDMMKFLKDSCCPDRKKACNLCIGYDRWGSFPRRFKCNFKDNEFWYSHSIQTRIPPSVYIDGNSVDAEENVPFQEGSIISFQPFSENDDRKSPSILKAEFQLIPDPRAATVVAPRVSENNPSKGSNNSNAIIDANGQCHVMEGLTLPQTSPSSPSWTRVRNLEIVSDAHYTVSDSFESATDYGVFHRNIGELEEKLDALQKKLKESEARHNAAQTALAKFQTKSSETLQKAKEAHQNNLLSAEIKHKESSQGEAKKLEKAHASEVAKLKDDMESDAKQQLKELNKKGKKELSNTKKKFEKKLKALQEGSEKTKAKEIETLKTQSTAELEKAIEIVNEKAKSSMGTTRKDHEAKIKTLEDRSKKLSNEHSFSVEKGTELEGKIKKLKKAKKSNGTDDAISDKTIAELQKEFANSQSNFEALAKKQNEKVVSLLMQRIKNFTPDADDASATIAKMNKLQKAVEDKDAKIEKATTAKAKLEEVHRKATDKLKCSETRLSKLTKEMVKLIKAESENVQKAQAKTEEDHKKAIDQLKSSSELSVSEKIENISKLQKNIDAQNSELEKMKQTQAKIEEDHKKIVDELKSSIESCNAESQTLVIEIATDCRVLRGKIGELKEELDCKTTIICICITTMILLLLLLLSLLKFSMPIFVGMLLLLLLQVPQVLLLAIPIKRELLAILDFGAFLGNIGQQLGPELLANPRHKKIKLIHAPVSVLTIVPRDLKKQKKKRKRE
jgi:hypothetical protein